MAKKPLTDEYADPTLHVPSKPGEGGATSSPEEQKKLRAMLARSTAGSKPFSKQELKRGYRVTLGRGGKVRPR